MQQLALHMRRKKSDLSLFRCILIGNRQRRRGNMKTRLLSTPWALLVIVGLLAASQCAAQLITADILGTVTDAAGAVVPNAKVTVVNTATSATRTLQTNGSGDYVFNLLPPGSYTVTVESPSFKKSVSNVT